MIKVAGLWLKSNENGEKYFTGSMGESVSVYVSKNKFKKEGSNQPDYILYFSESKRTRKAPPQNKSEEPEF